MSSDWFWSSAIAIIAEDVTAVGGNMPGADPYTSKFMGYLRVGDLLLGLTALALLRGRVQEFGGKSFSDARVADLRRILQHWDDPALQRDGSWENAPAAAGYAVWAATYDHESKPLIEVDRATLLPLIPRRGPGAALDAACGTGRWAAVLAERGFNVIGVDESPEMLERARTKVPSGDFRIADVRSLPVQSASLDLVVCSLALTHLPELDGVMTEFAQGPTRGWLRNNLEHPLPIAAAWRQRGDGAPGGTICAPATESVPPFRLHHRCTECGVPHSGL
jgi:SAM-dependent methyltransferase